jgi:hypothetical protein
MPALAVAVGCHLRVDATGIRLAWSGTGGNRNDVTQLIPLVDAVPAVRGAVGRPRKRPERIALVSVLAGLVVEERPALTVE